MTPLGRPLPEEVAARLRGTPRVILLDIDGTLAPIAPSPRDAVVSAATLDVIAALVRVPGTIVAVISGRGAEDARRLVPVPGIWVIGNHGIELLTPDGQEEANAAVATHGPAIARASATLHDALGTMDGVEIEDKRWTLSVHYRRASREVVPRVEEIVRSVVAKEALVLTRGKEVLELRPPVQVDKGSASVALVERLGGDGRTASVLCVGDDLTDEDAFRSLRARWPHSVTVRVLAESDGEPPATAAELIAPGPDAVRDLLADVLAL